MPGLLGALDARRMARRRMPGVMFHFVDGAAGEETGEQQNRKMLEDIRLKPRVLVNVSERSLATNFLSRDMGLPFGIAPMGMCNLTWPHADRYMAREAAQRKIPHGVSTVASTTLEEIFVESEGRAWFQLYMAGGENAAFDLIARAEAAGYEFLMLTVDTPHLSRRLRELRGGFAIPFKFGPKQIFDFVTHPRWSIESLLAGVPKPVNFDTGTGDRGFIRGQGREVADWDFVNRVRDRWKGKLIIKGVMDADDAVGIKEAGADAVYVSNHGGRQLDSTPSAIEALAHIRAAVGPEYPLVFDSGIRSGDDIIKALAVGANFVMVGRAILYGLGAGGARGLNALMDVLAEDIGVTMAQIGCRGIDEIDASVIASTPWERSAT